MPVRCLVSSPSSAAVSTHPVPHQQAHKENHLLTADGGVRGADPLRLDLIVVGKRKQQLFPRDLQVLQ